MCLFSQVSPTSSWVSCQSFWSYMYPGVRVGPREVTEPSSAPTCEAHLDRGSGIGAGMVVQILQHEVRLIPSQSESTLAASRPIRTHAGADTVHTRACCLGPRL